MGGSSCSSKDWDSFSSSRFYSDPKITTLFRFFYYHFAIGC